MHLGHAHDAPVRTHDHERRIDAGLTDTPIGHLGGPNHLRQDGGIDYRRPGSYPQSIEAAHLVTTGRKQSGGAGLRHQRHLAFWFVDPKRDADHDNLDPGRNQLRQPITDSLRPLLPLPPRQPPPGEKPIGAQPDVLRREAPLRSQPDRWNPGRPTGQPALYPLATGQNRHSRHIALQQGIGRLGRAMSDEGDILRREVKLAHRPLQRRDNAVRHPLPGIVGRRQLQLPDQLSCLLVDHHHIGEGASNVDPDSNFHRSIKGRGSPRQSAPADRPRP